MPYFAPYLDETGLHIPTYEERLEGLIASYKSIFGADINLAESSPDYQLLSVLARALDDMMAVMADLFASRNPNYASGQGLDMLLPLLGLTRAGATRSTVLVTLTGTPGAVLTSAPRILDTNGYIWACAEGIHIGENGTVTVRATCETPGAISAAAGSVSQLVAQVENLVSVTNAAAATPGVDAETDASARKRMRLAATAPSVGSMEVLRNEVLALPYALDCRIYVNDGDAADARGIQAHAFCLVANGGGKTAIANAIFRRKAPGIGTYGNQVATVTDEFGLDHQVRFKRASDVYYTLRIQLTPREGFDESHVVPAIKNAVYAYVSGLGIGEDLVIPALYGIVYGADTAETPTFLITGISATNIMNDTTVTDVLSPGWDEVFTVTGMEGIRVVVNN